MENIIGALFAMAMMLVIGAGIFKVQSQHVADERREGLAIQEAQSLIRFQAALDVYVKNNVNNLSAFASQPISASTLGLPSSHGVDVIGQKIGGFVSIVNAAPQSWVALPISDVGVNGVTAAEIRQSYGLDEPLVMASFSRNVAKNVGIISNNMMHAYVINTVDGGITPPDQGTFVLPGNPSPSSGSGAWDRLSTYFPTLPSFSGMTDMNVMTGMVSNVSGYWVWYAQIYNLWGTGCPSTGTTCAVNFAMIDAGWSPFCPSGGLTPVSMSSPFDFTVNSLPVGVSTKLVDPAVNSSSNSRPVCIPMGNSTYNAIVGAGFDYAGHCQSSGQGCSAHHSLSGKRDGYMTSCSGPSCQNTDLNNGRGYHPENKGDRQGEGASKDIWVSNSFNSTATYLYGTMLIKTPSGLHTVVYESGMNMMHDFAWWYTSNTLALFSGNHAGDAFYTAFGGTSPRYSWHFTKVVNTGNVNDPNNLNYTVLSLQ